MGREKERNLSVNGERLFVPGSLPMLRIAREIDRQTETERELKRERGRDGEGEAETERDKERERERTIKCERQVPVCSQQSS